MYYKLHYCNLTLHTFEALLSFKWRFYYGLNSAPKEHARSRSFDHYPALDSHLGFLFSTTLFMNYLLINQLIN
ncbi:hypothetical protein N9V60_02755 [Flavobacteriaceae bacterium]|nr:hypothetical protein [Flavobacteriaceae bacterium]MDB2340386.1 hypothetical protein [Flavobacteriaceae bacterium]